MNILAADIPTLLLLEDDQYLEEDIREFAENEGWRIITAHSVEEATGIVRERSHEITIAIVDMMVPYTPKHHELLRQLEMQRSAYIAEKFPQMSSVTEMSESELVITRSELVDIDQQIREALDFDGGRKFLRELSQRVDKFPVVVFSARLEFSDDEFVHALSEQKRWLGWKPKPIDPTVLAELLASVKGGVR